jgi:hypothetical protein
VQPYPQQPAYPAQQPYAAPQYPPATYPQQYVQPQAPAQPLPTGTLDTFYQQPSSSGGPSFKFQDPNTRQPQIGKSYAGFVARPVTDADVRAQTNDGGQVQTYKDGRPKFVLVVPMQVQPSQEFPEGQAGWWVKGQARDELARAMAEAGAPPGAPETGAFIRVTLVNVRPIPGRNPAYQYRIEYVRPGGATPAAQPVQVAPPVQQVPAPAPMPQPAPAVQQVAPAVQQVAPAPAPTAAPPGFSPEQAALFAKLTGQPTG